MKKLVVFFLLALFATTGSYAQFGMQLGCNISNYKLVVAGADVPRGMKFGLNAGLMYRTKGKRFGIQPTLLFTQKGVTRDNDVSGSSIDLFRNKLDYLECSVPILIKMPLAGPKNTFDIGAGPYFSKLIAAYSKAKYNDGHTTKTGFKIGTSESSDFTPTDYGLTIYVGGRFTHFNMSLVYDLGFYDVDPQPGGSIKNRCFSFNMGVFF